MSRTTSMRRWKPIVVLIAMFIGLTLLTHVTHATCAGDCDQKDNVCQKKCTNDAGESDAKCINACESELTICTANC